MKATTKKKKPKKKTKKNLHDKSDWNYGICQTEEAWEWMNE